MAVAAVRALVDEINGHPAPALGVRVPPGAGGPRLDRGRAEFRRTLIGRKICSTLAAAPRHTARGANRAGPTPAPTPPTDGDWWRDAVIYQVYPRSFADADGDGIGDLPGMRGAPAYLRRPRRGRHLAVARSTPRRRPTPATTWPTTATSTRIFGTLADFDALIADAHALGLRVIVDLVPNHTSDAARVVPGGAGRRARVARAGALPLPRRPGRGRRAAAQRLGVASSAARPGPGCADGAVVPAPVRPRAARPELGPPGGARRVRGRPAVLARPGRGRLPHRRGARHGQGGRAARRRPHDRPASARPTARHERLPYFDQDGVHEIYRAWRPVLDAYPGDRIGGRRGVGAEPRAAGPLRRPGRAAPGVQLRVPATPPGTPTAFRTVIDDVAGRGGRGRRADHLGAVQPRRAAGTSPATAAATWACAGPGPPRC